MLIYKNIKTICDAKGLSIAEVERKAGLKNGTIGKWRTHSPMVENLTAVADVLKVKIDKLIKG